MIQSQVIFTWQLEILLFAKRKLDYKNNRQKFKKLVVEISKRSEIFIIYTFLSKLYLNHDIHNFGKGFF